jgi:hypothetical protein
MGEILTHPTLGVKPPKGFLAERGEEIVLGSPSPGQDDGLNRVVTWVRVVTWLNFWTSRSRWLDDELENDGGLFL